MSHVPSVSVDLQPAPIAVPRTVLLALDDLLTRGRVGWDLRKAGYHVVEVNDGMELMDYLEQAVAPRPPFSLPDAIIATMRLDGFSGVEVCDALREFHISTPFILVVESEKDEALPEVVHAEPSYVCSEPVNSLLLRNLLSRLFE